MSVLMPWLCLAVTAGELPAPVGWPVPPGQPATPGAAYEPPLATAPPAAGVPVLNESSGDAGPDQTFFAVGQGLTGEVAAWCAGDAPGGHQVAPKVYLHQPTYVAATIPEAASDGPVLVWAKNAAGWSRPIRLNTPRLWWSSPDVAAPGAEVRLFGRDLALRPDRSTAYVWLAQGETGQWLPVSDAGKYALSVTLPEDLKPGTYQLWVHAGRGGVYGWSEPLALKVELARVAQTEELRAPVFAGRVDLQSLLDKLGRQGGGSLELAAGTYLLNRTLRLPAHVTVTGAGREATRLQLDPAGPIEFAKTTAGAWNEGPGRIHTAGDLMGYDIDVPVAGEYAVWLRYATEMSPWKQPGVSGKMSLKVDNGQPVALENLPNTGDFGTFKWSQSATLKLPQGHHTVTWRNDHGGGINLDAFVFAADPAYRPSDQPWPTTGAKVIVLQAEDATRFETKEGELPGRTAAVVWLAGDGAALENVTVAGSPQASTGVLIQHPDPLKWVDGCRLSRTQVVELDAKRGEVMGVHLHFASHALVTENEIWGRAPLFFTGLRQAVITSNRLVSVTRFGGNAEAAILGRCEVLEETIIEHNIVASPPDAAAGGPTARRLIWVSTGRGSVTHNWFADNGTDEPSGPGATTGTGPARFAGVAGTDQNVGEMILFEGNHRTMYFGPLAGADAASVTLPATVPATPDNRLGNVKRTDLAHNAQGQETPFLPPATWDSSTEPPLHEYYVTVFSGPGQGQSRRVVSRNGLRLALDRPWRQPPAAGSVVAVGTAFYQNLIVGNHVADGMTGIQLWISCIENVAAGNSIARQRRPAFYLYSNGTTLASSMPRTWNRGISPLFFNHIEGNHGEECSDGALVTSGEDGSLPLEFPRALGNVLRHNTFLRSRHNGVVITSRAAGPKDTSPAILGTIVEFQMVRDQRTAFTVGGSANGVVFRRNHAYFWYPVSLDPEPSVGFDLAAPGLDVAMDQNNVEGTLGEENPKGVVRVKQPAK